MSKVVLYTLRNCGTSDKARAALAERGVDFEERRVDENAGWWEEALRYSFTVPVIIWDNGDVEIGWEGEHG
jgi:glutaredoxin